MVVTSMHAPAEKLLYNIVESDGNDDAIRITMIAL